MSHSLCPAVSLQRRLCLHKREIRTSNNPKTLLPIVVTDTMKPYLPLHVPSTSENRNLRSVSCNFGPKCTGCRQISCSSDMWKNIVPCVSVMTFRNFSLLHSPIHKNSGRKPLTKTYFLSFRNPVHCREQFFRRDSNEMLRFLGEGHENERDAITSSIWVQ